MKTRVTVTFNRLDPEDDLTFLSEWVHASGYSADAAGVWLECDGDPDRMFVPWSSVLRVDWDPCHCAACADPEPVLVDEPEPSLT